MEKTLAVSLLLLLLLCSTAGATTSCPSWDVQVYCCPSACSAKKLPGHKEDTILRSCMRGLGCSEDESSHGTVFQMCTCP